MSSIARTSKAPKRHYLAQMVLGKPDEASYNMFLSVMETWWRLRLWHTDIHEQKLWGMWNRVTERMKAERIRRKLAAQKILYGEP